MGIQLYNTLTRKKEPFEPIEPGRVRMYNCGPTVYSFAHLGNFASFLLADLLRRYLEYSGLSVLQVMNITDVGHLTDDHEADARGEDKLEKKAREEKKDPWEIARFYEKTFHEDREVLNVTPAHHYPRATEHIPEMIAITEELLGKGLAYVAADQVYFEIARFPKYGILSGNTPEELIAGKRVEEDPAKRSPLDFCLWKKDPKHIMQWDSPWGRGFPGWHIECSAMSRKYLGDVFDIHTGGEDNIFPHHDCEIAQSSGGEDRICARFWLHRRHILVDGKKMSKSLGNFHTIRDLIERGHSGAAIRHALIGAHYRSQLNFTLEGLEAARESLKRFREFRRNMLDLPGAAAGSASDREAIAAEGRQADRRFREAMDDDLNVSAALAEVHEFLRFANKTARTRAAGEEALRRLDGWDRVLGFIGHSERSEPFGLEKAGVSGAGAAPGEEKVGTGGFLTDAEIEKQVAAREAARRRKDFQEADRIRKLVESRGIQIKDTPQGPRWFRE